MTGFSVSADFSFNAGLKRTCPSSDDVRSVRTRRLFQLAKVPETAGDTKQEHLTFELSINRPAEQF